MGNVSIWLTGPGIPRRDLSKSDGRVVYSGCVECQIGQWIPSRSSSPSPQRPLHDKLVLEYKVSPSVYRFPHAICCNRMGQNASAGPWPELIMRSFVAGASNATFGGPFYGSWNRLLTTLFPPDTTFEVVPQYFPPMVQGRDSFGFLVTYIESSPVFIVEIKHPNDFVYHSNREEADLQVCRRFRDCAENLRIPILHGVSAFGTKLAFYKYHKASRRLEPRQITPDPNILTDTAPREWWSCDILEEEGANRFRAGVDEVKAMSANLD